MGDSGKSAKAIVAKSSAGTSEDLNPVHPLQSAQSGEFSQFCELSGSAVADVHVAVPCPLAFGRQQVSHLSLQPNTKRSVDSSANFFILPLLFRTNFVVLRTFDGLSF